MNNIENVGGTEQEILNRAAELNKEFVEQTSPNNIILDATVLSTLMSCARMTDFRFNLHLQSISGKSPSLEMGSIVHTFLEVYYKNVILGLKKTDAEGTADIAAREYAFGLECNSSSHEEREWAIETCHQYLEFYKNDFWIPLEVEIVKGKILYQDDDIRILWKAKFDLLMDTNNGIFPVDHKTMKQRRDTISLNNQFIGQCLLADTRTMFVNKIGFQKTLKPAERFTRVPITYSADRLIEWQSEILPYYAKLFLMYKEANHYPPNYTHCENKYGFCQFREVCESDRNIREQTLGNNFVVSTPWDVTNDA